MHCYESRLLIRLGSGRTGSRGMQRCRSSSGSQGHWWGRWQGSWIVKAGVVHVQPSRLGSHTGVHLEEQRMNTVVHSECDFYGYRSTLSCEDPLLSGGRWGPPQNRGLPYRPSNCHRWWNLLRLFSLQYVLMTHTPDNRLGPVKPESCLFHSLCSYYTHGWKHALPLRDGSAKMQSRRGLHFQFPKRMDDLSL